LKPELREAHDYKEERDTEPKDAKVITDKDYVNKLSKTERVQCISTPMGMGKTFALKKSSSRSKDMYFVN